MGRWPFRRPLSVDFIQVPHEPSGAELAAWRPQQQFTTQDVVALIDRELTTQSKRRPDDRNTEMIDVLLMLRNALTVPVVPGRSS